MDKKSIRLIFLLWLISFGPSFARSQNIIKDKKSYCEKFIAQCCLELAEIVNQANIPYDFYFPSNDRTDLIVELPTLMHEEYHSLNLSRNLGIDSSAWVRIYFFKGTDYRVDKGKIFESSEMSEIVPKRIRDSIFRYSTYISGKDEIAQNPDSKVNGIYGILEEFAAYCTGFRVYVKSYSALKAAYSFDSTSTWIKYLTNANGSDVYAYYEFKLFILWYMELAKMKYPRIYAELNANNSLKNFNTLIDREFNSLLLEYWNNRKEIEKNIEPKIIIRDYSIYEKSNLDIGYGLPDEQFIYTKKLYDSRKEAILRCLQP